MYFLAGSALHGQQHCTMAGRAGLLSSKYAHADKACASSGLVTMGVCIMLLAMPGPQKGSSRRIDAHICAVHAHDLRKVLNPAPP